jgi:hypothetical protein
VIEGVSHIIVDVEDRDRALTFWTERMDTGAETIYVTDVWQSDQNHAASLELVEVKEAIAKAGAPRRLRTRRARRGRPVESTRRRQRCGSSDTNGVVFRQAAPEGSGERITPTSSQRARVASTSQHASASPAMRSQRWSMTLAGDCGTQ